MSRSGEIVLPFGGEERTFRLGIGEWRAVQEKCDAGPSELLARMAPPFLALREGLSLRDLVGSGLLGRWRVDDIRVVIFHALVGGGMATDEAMRLVVRWVDERPLTEPLPVAYQAVYASVIGVDDELASGAAADASAGERPGEGTRAPPLSPAASSASAATASTPRAARSASRRARSTP